jgi:hypothetical protein
MAAFFARTCFLWYALAVLIIMRWFHVASANRESEVPVHRMDESEAPSISHLTVKPLDIM